MILKRPPRRSKKISRASLRKRLKKIDRQKRKSKPTLSKKQKANKKEEMRILGDRPSLRLAQIEGIEINYEEITEQMRLYAQEQFKLYETPVKSITRHMMGLFKDRPGARAWRQYLSQEAHKDAADSQVILRAYEAMLKSSGRRNRIAA